MIKINWENPESYSFTDHHGLWQWGWEFLRRNPKYQEDWKRVKTFSEAEDPEDQYPAFNYDKDYTISIYERKSDLAKKEQEYLKNTWLLESYLDPACDCPYIFDYLPEFIVGENHTANKALPCVITTEQGLLAMAEKLNIINTEQFAVQIDLFAPIADQLNRLAPYLIALQKEMGIKAKRTTFHNDHWKMYLRVLDAHQAGFRREHAAKQLFQEISTNFVVTWDQKMKQAKVMMEEGFRKLIIEPCYFA